jgi:hypothetical protein
MYKLTGKLLYEPHRQDFRKSFKAKPLIVQFPYDDLDLYYQWFLRKQYGSWFDHELRMQTIWNTEQTAKKTITENIPLVYRPMFGCHVTIVRGDEPGWKHKAWRKYEGQKLTVEVSPVIYKQRIFWALPIKCKRAHEIRHELGLHNFHNLHLTVAREPEGGNPYWSPRQREFLREQAFTEAGDFEEYTTVEDS